MANKSYMVDTAFSESYLHCSQNMNCSPVVRIRTVNVSRADIGGTQTWHAVLRSPCEL